MKTLNLVLATLMAQPQRWFTLSEVAAMSACRDSEALIILQEMTRDHTAVSKKTPDGPQWKLA